jgi:hypothetical protein
MSTCTRIHLSLSLTHSKLAVRKNVNKKLEKAHNNVRSDNEEKEREDWRSFEDRSLTWPEMTSYEIISYF